MPLNTVLYVWYANLSFIHKDRGQEFMSSELNNFLLQKGNSTSRTTSYDSPCNGQVERLNGTLYGKPLP